jgi:hypothetical protein
MSYQCRIIHIQDRLCFVFYSPQRVCRKEIPLEDICTDLKDELEVLQRRAIIMYPSCMSD